MRARDEHRTARCIQHVDDVLAAQRCAHIAGVPYRFRVRVGGYVYVKGARAAAVHGEALVVAESEDGSVAPVRGAGDEACAMDGGAVVEDAEEGVVLVGLRDVKEVDKSVHAS